ncbi:MAG: ORF6N domain-containing protein [Bacteroidales bacterium]|nr:ORF6N domain-containing protein [Bacteroidales bacterium]
MEQNIIMKTNKLALFAEYELWSKIHIIRGVQVMLDFDLAAIYGYSTKRFNEQVKNNIERFDESFRFQLTDSEFKFLRSKISTSSWGGARYLPFAFTEEGIYMLMAVLKGELAVNQSKKLIKLFKQMKDFIIQHQNVLSGPELVRLSMQTISNTEEIQQIKQQMVTHDELAMVIKDFTNPSIRKDYLFYNGQTVEADIAYVEIYSYAKKTIDIIDNYISLKTLVLLKSVAPTVKVTVFSDNTGRYLHPTEFKDFRYEYPNVDITLRTTGGIYHDRYIIIDHNSPDEIIFHCGGSSKDSGRRITSISRIEDVELYKNIIASLQNNPVLVL